MTIKHIQHKGIQEESYNGRMVVKTVTNKNSKRKITRPETDIVRRSCRISRTSRISKEEIMTIGLKKDIRSKTLRGTDMGKEQI